MNANETNHNHKQSVKHLVISNFLSYNMKPELKRTEEIYKR